jgi:hypothetical protein
MKVSCTATWPAVAGMACVASAALPVNGGLFAGTWRCWKPLGTGRMITPVVLRRLSLVTLMPRPHPAWERATHHHSWWRHCPGWSLGWCSSYMCAQRVQAPQRMCLYHMDCRLPHHSPQHMLQPEGMYSAFVQVTCLPATIWHQDTFALSHV